MPEPCRTPRLLTCAVVSGALVLSACKTSPTAPGASSGAGDYATSCVAGSAIGAVLGAVIDRATNKKATSAERRSTMLKAAAAGCAVGLAATAIGRLMDDRQRARHEAEMQNEARRRALEQQQYATATQRAQSLPAATPQQRAARDAELDRARAAYEASIAQPVQVDLGNGGTSTIQVQPQAPSAPQAGAATAGAAPGTCTEFSVLVRTASGQARQYETWCPNASGQMVRTEVRDTPAG